MVTVSRATPTNFSLVLTKFPSLTSLRDQDKVTLHLFETVIPSMTIPAIENRWMSILARSDPVHDIDYGEWNVSFVVDSNFENWIILHDYLKYVTSSSANPDLDHIYPKDNTIRGSLVISDNYRTTVLTVNFYDVWLSSLGEVRLTYRDGDMYIEGSATFKYSYYDIETP